MSLDSKKVFRTIGATGFITLIPVILHALGIDQFQDVLSERFGAITDLGVLSIISFFLIGSFFITQKGENHSASVISFLIGFMLIFTFTRLSILDSFTDVTDTIFFLENPSLNLFVGLFILSFGLLLSLTPKMSIWKESIWLIIVPFFALVSLQDVSYFENGQDSVISLDESFVTLSNLIDPRYSSQPEIVTFIETINETDSLNEQQKREEIEKLQQRINKLEQDKTILEQKSNALAMSQTIDSLEAELKKKTWCANTRSDGNRVKTYHEAVVPNVPCVRDFALSIVQKHQGTYYLSDRRSPSKQGIKQVILLHYKISNKWKYISDPTVLQDDYFSTANHTIGNGLVGDCDDFSILMASCIEAVGGVARIMYGRCDAFAHAWAEVYVGSKLNLEKFKQRIRAAYKDPSRRIAHSMDENGDYWIPLDWDIGVFTCNTYEKYLHVDYHSDQQIH